MSQQRTCKANNLPRSSANYTQDHSASRQSKAKSTSSWTYPKQCENTLYSMSLYSSQHHEKHRQCRRLRLSQIGNTKLRRYLGRIVRKSTLSSGKGTKTAKIRGSHLPTSRIVLQCFDSSGWEIKAEPVNIQGNGSSIVKHGGTEQVGHLRFLLFHRFHRF